MYLNEAERTGTQTHQGCVVIVHSPINLIIWGSVWGIYNQYQLAEHTTIDNITRRLQWWLKGSIEDQGSKIEDQRSWIEDRGAEIKDRGVWCRPVAPPSLISQMDRPWRQTQQIGLWPCLHYKWWWQNVWSLAVWFAGNLGVSWRLVSSGTVVCDSLFLLI